MVYIYLVHATCIHYYGRFYIVSSVCSVVWVFASACFGGGGYKFVLLLLPYDHHLFCLFLIIYGVATNVYLQIRKEFIMIFSAFFHFSK